MAKQRLDQRVVDQKLTKTRSQAESYIKLGEVTVDGRVITKPGFMVNDTSVLKIKLDEQYVSRAALKLASVAADLQLDFDHAVVLDVGSSTGGFSDYALRHGASHIIAVELGTDQLHPSLRGDKRITLYEKTDIRSVGPKQADSNYSTKFSVTLDLVPDIIVIDVSFISLREILPHLKLLSAPKTKIVAMLKPQFEASQKNIKHRGVIKNDHLRREIIKDFESWTIKNFLIVAKADSEVTGSKGNRERFYLLKKL